ncbi:MAG: prenyltransferase/squalene oxidase repeat-containing protein [Candidatus Helarchaeota archaeon]
MKRKTKKRLITATIFGLLLGTPIIAMAGFGFIASVPIPILPDKLIEYLGFFDEFNINYTLGHQNVDGIFVEPSIEINYYAQEILTNLSSPVTEEVMMLFTRLMYMISHKNVDGGFSEVGGAGDVITTYRVLRFLYLVNSSFLKDPSFQQYFNDTITFLNDSAYLGGYAIRPNSQVVTVETTYCAAMSLVILNQSDLINNVTLGGFLTLCHNNSITDGGFYTSILSNDTNVKSTHYGMELAKTFGILLIGNDSKFIDDCQNPDGGFGNMRNATSDVEATYHGIMGLRQDGLLPSNLTGAQAFLKAAQNQDGGFGNHPRDISEFSAAFHVILGLNATGDSLTVSNESSFYSWSLQNEGNNGLFGYKSVRANYWAMSALISAEAQGRVSQGQKREIASFIQQCQNTDGGFGTRDGTINSTLFDTFCAIHVIKMLESSGRGIYLSLYVNVSSATTYLKSFQNHDGGFMMGANIDLFWDYMTDDFQNQFEDTINENISLSMSSYWAFSSLLRLGQSPDDSLGFTLWMKSLQNIDGGFGATTGLWSEVVSTYYVIKTFSLISENINSIPSAIEYLKNAQNPDGGFNLISMPTGMEFGEISSTYLFVTYCAAEGLYLLGSQPGTTIFDIDALYQGASWVYSCAPLSMELLMGGFGDIPYFGADIRNIEMGITLMDDMTVNQGLMTWAKGWLLLLFSLLIVEIAFIAAWYGYKAVKIVFRKFRPIKELAFHEILKDRVAIKCEGVTIKAGSKVIIDNVSLKLNHGEILGVIGESGAGKSTFIKSLIGTMYYSGSISIYELDSKKDKQRLKSIYGYVPQDLSKIYESFTVLENLMHFGKEYGLDEEEILRRSRKILMDLGILEKENELVKNLSGGQKRRASIAVGMIHQPVICILDEPTSGLDPVVRDQLWYALLKVNEEYKTTLVVITHYPEDSRFCDKIAIFGRQRGLIDFGRPQELYQKLPGRGRALDVELKKGQTDVLQKLRGISRFEHVLEIKRNEIYRILTDLTSAEVLLAIEKQFGSGFVENVEQKETIMADLFRMKSLEVKLE